MQDGLMTELSELIALKRYARRINKNTQKTNVTSGPVLSKLRGRGVDFAEVRNYQAGDEIRHMEWRVTARTGRPHVKLFEEEREQQIILLIDFNPSMYFGTRVAFKSVIAARLAALIAWTGIKQGDRVGGLVYSATTHSEFLPRTRDSGVLSLLASLSRYTQTNVKHDQSPPRLLSDALLRLRRVMKPGSTLVILSDLYHVDAESMRHLARLRTHNNILVYHICDLLELTPPKPACYAMTNGTESILFDTGNHAFYEAYQMECDQRIARLQRQCHQYQIPYIQVTSETNLPRLVWQTFPRRKHG